LLEVSVERFQVADQIEILDLQLDAATNGEMVAVVHDYHDDPEYQAQKGHDQSLPIVVEEQQRYRPEHCCYVDTPLAQHRGQDSRPASGQGRKDDRNHELVGAMRSADKQRQGRP